MKNIFSCRYILSLLLVLSLLTACGESRKAATANSGIATEKALSGSDAVSQSRDNTPLVLTPEASGSHVIGTDTITIDVSNASQGYVMVRYTGDNPKVRFQVVCPDGMTFYNYLLHCRNEDYEAFPLTGGDGLYTLTVYENIAGDTYSIAFSENIEFALDDPYLPYLYANQYVHFHEGDDAISLGQSITADCVDDLDVISTVYSYITTSIAYDYDKVTDLSYDYLPDNDETLKTGRGICFDYAVLMASILRSQRIPTRLEVGYLGEIYHAWISTYISEIGWINNIIEFDGHDWTLLDPTLSSTNDDPSSDTDTYYLKYTY